MNDIAETIVKTEYSPKLMKIVIMYQQLLNDTNDGLEKLYQEDNPLILAAMMWTWINHLKEPVITDQEISKLLSCHKENSKAESNWHSLDKSILETVDCLLNLIRELLPIEEHLENLLIDKLIASLTQTQIKSALNKSLDQDQLKQLPSNKYLLIKSIFKSIIDKPVIQPRQKSLRFDIQTNGYH